MKIIVADDEAVTQLLISEKLTEWGYTVLAAKNGVEVLDLLAQHDDVQLFLLDWQMPELDGLNLCSRLKNQSSLKCSYIIILTSKKATENIVTAFEAGADDFISKPFAPEELQARLRVGARMIASENRLLYQAQHDPLTEVLNHRAIIDELSNLWHRSKRDGSTLSVMMLDIDFFKRVNDDYGHQAGDYALKLFCKLVTKEIRPYDSLGRYGGEEFTVTLPATDADQALIIAERIRNRIESSPIEYDGLCFCLTVSIGIANYSENQKSHKEILMAADKAVYQAKNNGRNRVVIAEN